MSSTILVDFDGTICNTHGQKDDHGMTPMMEGARAALSLLREQGHEVIIHTCNRKAWVEKWCLYHDIRIDGVWTEKPVGTVYIDDRALRFVSWPDAIQELKGLLK